MSALRLEIESEPAQLDELRKETQALEIEKGFKERKDKQE